jgi:Na+-translocating ferredoxin:NAD+ oxidoreductase RnfD subunit
MSDTTAPPPPTVGESASAEQAGASAAAPSATKSRTGPPKMFGIDVRFVPPIFITLILLVGHLSAGFLESPAKTILAIVAAMLAEVILGRLVTGKWPHLASAYITGISVGILVRSPAFWPYAVCSVISITSKYVIRWKGRHLWNPSNFGICMMLLFASYTFTTLSIQWGNNLLPMVIVWIIGAIIVARLKRFHITLTYVISFFAFAFLRSAITHDPWLSEVAPITGPMYQLYIFFMITDPKSTVLTKKGQILVAFLIAAVECGLRLLHHFGPSTLDDYSVHAPYYALFIVGPIANMIEIARTPLKQAPPK